MKIFGFSRKNRVSQLPNGRGARVLELDREAIALMILLVERKISIKRVLKKGGKLILVNMTEGESFGSGIYRLIYRLAPKAFGGCRGVELSAKLAQRGFEVASREYYQQLGFPSEVILARL